jgi:outer membrane lipoprotein SlyB
MAFNRTTPVALAGLLALGACAAVPPTGPSVMALPPAGKDLAAFQADDVSCRQYAVAQTPYAPSAAAAASQNAVGSAAVGTALGAAAGAGIGSLAGAVGTGAAVGAGAGLLAGSAVGSNKSEATTAELQQNYDIAYSQCMASKGNSIQNPPGPPVVAGYSPYLDPYWPYWFGGPVFVGSAFGFGRFHHRDHFFHDRDHFHGIHGFHGQGGGFHGQGGFHRG